MVYRGFKVYSSHALLVSVVDVGIFHVFFFQNLFTDVLV
jgi:hypothetical protein